LSGCCYKQVGSSSGPSPNVNLWIRSTPYASSFGPIHTNTDQPGGDINCYTDGRSENFCAYQCLQDATCLGYNRVAPGTVWGAASGCCYKNALPGLGSYANVNFWVKGGFAPVQANTDHGGDDINCYTDGRSSQFCANACLLDETCTGYNDVCPGSVWGAASGCCYKRNVFPQAPSQGVNFYVRTTAYGASFGPMMVNTDHAGDDINCYTDGRSSDFCAAMCIADSTCLGYNHVRPGASSGAGSGCCYKRSITPLSQGSTNIDFWVKSTSFVASYGPGLV